MCNTSEQTLQQRCMKGKLHMKGCSSSFIRETPDIYTHGMFKKIYNTHYGQGWGATTIPTHYAETAKWYTENNLSVSERVRYRPVIPKCRYFLREKKAYNYTMNLYSKVHGNLSQNGNKTGNNRNINQLNKHVTFIQWNK